MTDLTWWQSAGVWLVILIACCGVAYCVIAALRAARGRRLAWWFVSFGASLGVVRQSMAFMIPLRGDYYDNVHAFALPLLAWILFTTGIIWLSMTTIEDAKAMKEITGRERAP